MRKIFMVLAFFVATGGLWFVLSKWNPPLVEVAQQIKLPSGPSTVLPIPHLESWQAESASPKPIPESMRGATDDPAVVELLTTFEKSEIGKVVTTEKGTQQLWYGDRLLFEAKRIGARSRAENGTIAFDAVTGNQAPIKDAEIVGAGDNAKLLSSPREIWLVTSTGSKTKASPQNMDAFAPVIDPGGARIAFTGRLLNQAGFPSAEQLYVSDIATGQYRVFAGDKHLHDYRVWAVDWVNNSSVLRVLQDHGETGGHMKLMQVRFE